MIFCVFQSWYPKIGVTPPSAISHQHVHPSIGRTDLATDSTEIPRESRDQKAMEEARDDPTRRWLVRRTQRPRVYRVRHCQLAGRGRARYITALERNRSRSRLTVAAAVATCHEAKHSSKGHRIRDLRRCIDFFLCLLRAFCEGR
jgi:hypothetical protein